MFLYLWVEKYVIQNMVLWVKLQEVLVGPTQNVWVIEGPFGQVLMPAVDEFIKEAPAEGHISVSIPQGLLRLGE